MLTDNLIILILKTSHPFLKPQIKLNIKKIIFCKNQNRLLILKKIKNN